ncbi:MAG: hypothetical protein AUG45_12470 [Ktedonobacter sp. 13_1_20CM_3_54_15]|nr:MAG: hypothetical protein AUG82_07060 [Ktedonobacter sp. 13_1_20CM_4_53_11]OLE31598.1 MAG: hypothetical protein AUG45_12470 [Ktedonobacter sp. 13_1_20CM_3_54_15]
MEGGIIILAALVLILALRSPEVHLSSWHQWLWTRLTLVVCLSLFLVLSAGVVLFHGANAAPIGAPVASSTAVSSSGGLSPSPTPFPSLAPSLSASPSPTPIPSLTPSTAQVLTTFCDAIDRHDLDTAWGQYAKALQKERATPPPFLVRITIVHCRVDNVSETSATGFLLLKTIGPKGYTDDYERDFQFTLDVEEGVWKIAQVARCLADGCLDDTTSVVP